MIAKEGMLHLPSSLWARCPYDGGELVRARVRWKTLGRPCHANAHAEQARKSAPKARRGPRRGYHNVARARSDRSYD